MMWVGWYQEGTSDKLWGWFVPDMGEPANTVGQRCWVFWGRRGSSMSFKRDVYGDALLRTQQGKISKGYRAVDRTQLLGIWPTFDQDLASRLTWCVLTDTVR